jgi:diguanylate cyclase (GGDEF)-like protein
MFDTLVLLLLQRIGSMAQYSLRTLLAFFATALAVALTAVLGAVIQNAATADLKQVIGERLAQTSAELAATLDRAMYERYQDIALYAGTLTEFDLLDRPAAIRAHLDALLKAREGYAWIGYANPAGTVVAATGALLEGQDVTKRPWFGEASKAAFVGDLHRALLLEKKLRADGGEPLRFLDVAMPVIMAGERFAGVLGAHIDWRWIMRLTRSMASAASYEALIVGADGTVLFGPAALQDKQLDLPGIRRVRQGQSGYHAETWPDGKVWLTGYSRSRGYQDYPGLGWIIIERQQIDAAFAPVAALQRQVLLSGVIIAALFALLGWLLASRISRPLNAITRAAERLDRGEATTGLILQRGYHEVLVLSRTLAGLIANLQQREAELEHQATHNSLTRLPNRALVKALLGQMMTGSDGEAPQIAVLALDLDRFKTVNDTLGYAAGDAVLQSVAERLQGCMGPGAVLAHLGKDEFVIVLEQREAKLAQTELLAARARESLALPFHREGTELFISASIGIAFFPRDGRDADTLLGHAIFAMQQAKAGGGNRIEFYQTETNAAALEKHEMGRELRHALEARQFELHYQPQVALASGVVVGVEALIRWRHPQRGMISPEKFIPVAEASGLIAAIDDWTLKEACAQARAWRDQGLPPLVMSVNVAAQQFEDGRLIDTVSAALAANHLEPGSLKLEITEGMLMRDIDSSVSIMDEITRLGVHIAIDDFGTGYSSLAYLKRFPLSDLKIDQSFVRELYGHVGGGAIVRAIIALGRSLRLSVIAEGVESEAQARFLAEAGCDEIQGYYVSMALPADRLAAFLREGQPLSTRRWQGADAGIE